MSCVGIKRGKGIYLKGIIVNSLSGNFSVDVYLNYTREVYHTGDRRLVRS